MKKIEELEKGSQKSSSENMEVFRYSENMELSYKKTPTLKCDFNKVAKPLY